MFTDEDIGETKFTDEDISEAAKKAGADAEEFGKWLRGPIGSPQARWFFHKIAPFPHREAIKTPDALAFLHSVAFDRGLLALSRDERKDIVKSLIGHLPYLTPRQAASVACEIRGHRVFTFKSADAEYLRRGLLLRNLYSFSDAGEKDRLLALARDEMLKRAHAECSRISPSVAKPSVMESHVAERVRMSANETLICVPVDGGGVWHPCVLQTDQDPHLAHYKLAVLAMCVPDGEEFGDAIVVSVSERDFRIMAEIVEKRWFSDYIPEMREGVRGFFRHVENDIPCEYCAKDAVELDAETAAKLAAGYEKTAVASLVRRAAEKREKDLRAKLAGIMYETSRATGIPVSRLVPPKGAMSPSRMTGIDCDALDELRRKYPDADREMGCEDKPSPYFMEQKLIELEIPESEWKRPSASAPRVAAFCRMRDISLPGRDYVRFDVSRDRSVRDGLEKLIGPHLSALGLGEE